MQHVKRLSNAKILQNKTIRFLLPGFPQQTFEYSR